jgi:hypothetical protein
MREELRQMEQHVLLWLSCCCCWDQQLEVADNVHLGR